MVFVKRILLAAMVVAAAAPRVMAGPNRGGVLVVHATTIEYTVDVTDYTGQSGVACGQDSPLAPSVNVCPPYDPVDGAVPCVPTAANPTMATPPVGTSYVWYVLAAFSEVSCPRLKAVAFRIDYDPGKVLIATSGCDPAAFAVSLASDTNFLAYPASGSGIGITFPLETRTSRLTEIYWFAGYAYYGAVDATVQLRAKSATDFSFIDDSAPPKMDAIAGFGMLGLGGAAGLNPTPETFAPGCADVGIPTGLQPPAGGSLPAATMVTTSCQAVAVATSYDWELFTGATCDGSPLLTAATPNESADWIALPVGSYSWRVRAINDGNPSACSPADSSAWSPCSWFTIPHPNAEHCDFVTTDLPYAVTIDAAQKDGVPLVHGDVVGLFATYQNRWICVGSAPFYGTWPLSVQAMEADPGHGLPGFVPGDPIVIQLCATSGDTLVSTITWSDNGTYGTGPSSRASFVEFRSPWCHREIPLQANRWEWIGLGLRPADPLASSVFGGLLGNLIIAKDDEGHVYIPGVYDDLSPLGVENGCSVFLGGANATLEVTGSLPLMGSTKLRSETDDKSGRVGGLLPPSQDCIPISPGRWNLIPYLTDSCGVACVLDAGEAMGAWADSIVIVQTDAGDVWIPEQSVNTIGMMDPRLGYYLFPRATWPFDICYPSCRHGFGRGVVAAGAEIPVSGRAKPAAAKVPFAPDQTSLYQVQRTGMSEIVLVTEANAGLVSEGDEIAVICDGRVVGAVRFQGSWPLVVPVWRGNAELGLAGFTPGEPMMAELWERETSRRVALAPVTDDGEPATFRFEPYSSVRLVGSVASATGDPAILWARPNPSRGLVEVTCKLQQSGELPDVEVYDPAGRLVRRLMGAPRDGLLHATWDGTTESGSRVSSGVYFVRVRSGAKGSEQRLLILR